MKSSIQKVTSRGQITLPIRLREKWNTEYITVVEKDGGFFVTPAKIESLDNNNEYSVFDAIRDNQGKGIKAKDFVSILKRIQ